tara:strand:- start:313 stop:1071 length:759 start_codon:yes stop_codon:yes gene_type:complete
MNPEIEKLIDFALADGVITDKEREIIRKKAEKLGEDPDEAEMILDAKLAMKQNQKTPPNPPISTGPPPPSMPPPTAKQKSSKVGNIMTCPACGATINATKLSCGECGHEFRNTGLSNLMSEFKQKLDDAEKNAIQEKSTGFLGKILSMVDSETENERKIFNAKSNVIKNFPIPSNKEDIVEFLSFSISQANGVPVSAMDKFAGSSGTYGHKIVLKNAWITMADSIKSKAQFLDSNDNSFVAKINELYNELDR